MNSVSDGNAQEKEKYVKNKILPSKQYMARNSLLTDLYKIDHCKSLYCLFLCVLVTALIKSITADILGVGGLSNMYRIIIDGFGQFYKVIGIWLLMVGSTISIYHLFWLWAYIRLHLKPVSFMLKIWDRLWIVGFIVYYVLFFHIPLRLKGSEMPIVSSSVIVTEQIRLLMKAHAFVRSNVPKILSYKVHSEQKSPIPDFSKYIYFLVVPALIYRDEYPRTKSIRWWFVAMNFGEFAVAILFLSFLIANYLEPEFKNACLIPFTWRTVTMLIFPTTLPGTLCLFSIHYLLFHAWMNAWAEMTRFADRCFYADWWNTCTLSAFYKKWNVVVHDYLHEYIYRDVFESITQQNKFVAAMAVFSVSAVVHEYIIATVLGFFYPVLFVKFIVFGVFFFFIKIRNKPYLCNTFHWWSLSFGSGISFTLYTIEWYTRINCPRQEENWTDFYIPRSWTCTK